MMYSAEMKKYVMLLYMENNRYTLFTSENLLLWERTQDIELKGDNEDEIRNLAQLTSISDTHFDKKAVAEAQKRIAELMSSDGNTRKRHSFRFVLDDQHVITHLSQFRNAEARTLAKKCFETGQQISEAIDHLDALREQYAKRKTVTLSKQILESEKALEEACGKLSSMEKRVRQLELGK